MAHELIRSLPDDTRQKLEVMLVKDTSAVECAQWLQAQGLCSTVSAPSLARAVRRYKLDEITVHEAARREAVAHAPERVRARVKEQITAMEAIGKLKQIALSRDKAFWAAVEKMPPGLGAVSEGLRKSAESAFAMWERITKLAMDAGLIQRAPAQLHIRAEHVVINDHGDAVALMEALLDFYSRKGETHPWLPQIQAMATGRENSRLSASRPKPVELSAEGQRVWADVQAQLAEARAEKQAALTVREPTRAEPVDVGPGVPVEGFDDPEIEVLERDALPARRRVIDVEPDDGRPSLESIW